MWLSPGQRWRVLTERGMEMFYILMGLVVLRVYNFMGVLGKPNELHSYTYAFYCV